MKKVYSLPKVSIISIEETSMLASSFNRNVNTGTFAQKVVTEYVAYKTLTQRQKLAALNLMKCFGAGSCPCSSEYTQKINHILIVMADKMGISWLEYKTSSNMFSSMEDMVSCLKGANKIALENIFMGIYCIVALGKSKEAVCVLLQIFSQLGFREQDCISILESKTGVKIEDL